MNSNWKMQLIFLGYWKRKSCSRSERSLANKIKGKFRDDQGTGWKTKQKKWCQLSRCHFCWFFYWSCICLFCLWANSLSGQLKFSPTPPSNQLCILLDSEWPLFHFESLSSSHPFLFSLTTYNQSSQNFYIEFLQNYNLYYKYILWSLFGPLSTEKLLTYDTRYLLNTFYLKIKLYLN